MRYVDQYNPDFALPFMYSYRRCPYAMRSRLAMHLSSIDYYLFEITLKNKPDHLLHISPKGTVPVLIINKDVNILEESLDIMLWAFKKGNVESKMIPEKFKKEIFELIEENDSFFKSNLDLYKYSKSEIIISNSFTNCLKFVNNIKQKVESNGSIVPGGLSMADYAIFPFIRQFINVDLAKYSEFKTDSFDCWFKSILNSEIFKNIMRKPDFLFDVNH